VFKEMGWHRAIDEAGFAIRPGRFSHEWLDRLLQAIHELAPQPSRAGVRHALRPVPIAEFRAEIGEDQLLRDKFQGGMHFHFARRSSTSLPDRIGVVWHPVTALPLAISTRNNWLGDRVGQTGNSRGTCADKRSAPSSGIAGELR
jgi:hypothetical protein